MKPGYYGLGGWSSPPAAAAAASITFRDSGQHRGITTSDVNIASMATENLDFVAGNLVILFARIMHAGSTGTVAEVTEGAATGWNKFGFEDIGPAEDAFGIIAAWKVVDGTETMVNLLTRTGAQGTITNNFNYLAVAYDIVGTPNLVMHTSELLNVGVATQTITSSGGDVPILAFSWAGGTTQPDQTFATQTPDQNIAYGNGGSGGSFVRLKTKLFTSAPADITTGFSDLGTANGLISGYFEVSL